MTSGTKVASIDFVLISSDRSVKVIVGKVSWELLIEQYLATGTLAETQPFDVRDEVTDNELVVIGVGIEFDVTVTELLVELEIVITDAEVIWVSTDVLVVSIVIEGVWGVTSVLMLISIVWQLLLLLVFAIRGH